METARQRALRAYGGQIMDKVNHNIRPVYDADSKVLVLGSFPSVKSREARFFYGHPQNRFWKVLAAVTGVFAAHSGSGLKTGKQKRS